MMPSIATTCILAIAAIPVQGDIDEMDRLKPVPFTNVRITDSFWSDRIETNRRVTIPYDFEKCEETGRIANFAKAGGLIDGAFEGIYYNDSDVYKVIEGAAYSLAAHPDPELDAYLDDLIGKIAAAQQPDGYLNTYYTLVEPENRWTDIRVRHELYCAGHLFEAAVAHHEATGKRSLLDVAIRLANHIDSVFGPDGLRHPPGHEEIEIGLVRLYRATGEKRYLDLAKFFINERGNAEVRPLYGRYAQDHAPVIEQDAPVGHAVRAMYLYAGVADVASLTGDHAYIEALDRIWSNMVGTKLYLTGGIGATSAGEAFGEAFELPNASAYNETCAAIGNALFNHRMNLLSRDARYMDVVERVIYNGFLSGVSLGGDRFFYPNPLASGGTYHRSPWFSTSCCPVNVVRFVPSIPSYMYAQDDSNIYVNLFAESESTITLKSGLVAIKQETQYPWSGEIDLHIDPAQPNTAFTLHVRIPGWVRDQPVPGDLYRYVDDLNAQWSVTINDEPVGKIGLVSGYLPIDRRWSPGDAVSIRMEMPVRRVRSHAEVDANTGRVAFERGPIVYCVEGADTDGFVRHLWVDESTSPTARYEEALLDGVVVLEADAHGRRMTESGEIETFDVPFRMIPYYGWDHREPGEMTVWLPTQPELAEIIPAPTIASRATAHASHTYESDSVDAVNDLRSPSSSSDHSIPRHTFWPHRGTDEWLQYDFDAPVTLDEVSVYWFDDEGRGACRTPRTWHILYHDGSTWREVSARDGYGTTKDAFNRVRFEPVTTDALRIVVALRDGFSAGVLEWTLGTPEPKTPAP